MSNIIENLEIKYLNDLGVGVGFLGNKKIFVPYTLPNEIVTATITNDTKHYSNAKLIKVNTLSRHRGTPICKHFSMCGNCALQHLNDIEYNKFKTEIFYKAISDAGLDVINMFPIINIGQYSRRKINLKISGKKIGFYKYNSHEIIEIKECYVMDKLIFAFVLKFRQFLQNHSDNIFKSITITIIEEKLDIILEGEKELSLKIINELISYINNQHEVIRLTYSYNYIFFPIITKSEVTILLGNSKLPLPAENFLQASIDAQNFMTKKIVEYAKNYNNILDLYAGCGTYSLPLSEYSNVHIVEGSDAMINSIKKAVSVYPKKNKISYELRDLYNNPILAQGLKKYDLAIINPPRNGATPQITEIVKSKISNLIMVSCNPKTFARDAKLLKNNNFKLTYAVPIDQFLYSYHLEILAIFSK